jgi:hypothetical protein
MTNHRVDSNVQLLIRDFPEWLRAFKKDYPFRKPEQLKFHVRTIKKRREFGSVQRALDDDEFLGALYETLKAWGIGARASVIKEFPDFAASLRSKSNAIAALETLCIDQENLDTNTVASQIWALIDSLNIVENKTTLVPGSKLLHHLLPDLIVPIDREYTQKFFRWGNPKFQNRQEECFRQAFATFIKITREVNPNQYVADGWCSSQTKVLDNAVVGFMVTEKELHRTVLRTLRRSEPA